MRNISLILALLLGAAAQGQVPVNPSDMLHLLITQNGQSLTVSFETAVFDTPILEDFGDTYTGPGAVLTGRAYNSQYGWLANGFFNLNGNGIFVRPVEIDQGLAFYDEFSFAPILTTSGSAPAWRWTGQMTHNWVAATIPGDYEATFEVYVGDPATGEPLPGWTPAMVTLAWTLPGADCPADVNADGSVSDSDFFAWVSAFIDQTPACDVNLDGSCSDSDFFAWVTAFVNGGC
ncbi:MAG: GC-type dockerin domain-anchored protein [Planctomycetota bacterium]